MKAIFGVLTLSLRANNAHKLELELITIPSWSRYEKDQLKSKTRSVKLKLILKLLAGMNNKGMSLQLSTRL